MRKEVTNMKFASHEFKDSGKVCDACECGENLCSVCFMHKYHPVHSNSEAAKQFLCDMRSAPEFTDN